MNQLPERFLDRTVPEPNTGCVLWCAGGGKYGSMSWGGRVWIASRLAWHLANGPIPVGRFVCHRCDTPGCVNPEHLFLGTPLDNSSDARSKGRTKHPRTGVARRSHCARGHALTDDNVYYFKNGARNCRTCTMARSRNYYRLHGDLRSDVRRTPQTHCRRGHPYAGRSPSGRPQCLICDRERKKGTLPPLVAAATPRYPRPKRSHHKARIEKHQLDIPDSPIESEGHHE